MFPSASPRRPSDDDENKKGKRRMNNTNEMDPSEVLGEIFRETIAKHLQPMKREQQKFNNNENYYYPSIFRYKCRGAFHATTTTGNNNDDDAYTNNNNNMGLCHGIQTQLKHVRDIDHKSYTKQESIDLFLRATSSSSASTMDNGDNIDTTEDEMNFPSALIYDTTKEEEENNDPKTKKKKKKSEYHQIRDYHEHKVIEMRKKLGFPMLRAHQQLLDEKKKEEEEERKRKQKEEEEAEAAAVAKKENKSPEEKKNSTWQNWSAYGSTEVHVMVLRDAQNLQKKGITVGISPVCHYGVSVRDMGKRDEKIKTTTTNSLATLHLSPLEIAVGSTTTEEEEDADHIPRILNEEEYYNVNNKDDDDNNKIVGPVDNADEDNKSKVPRRHSSSQSQFSRRKQQMITDYKKRYGENTPEDLEKKSTGMTFQKVYDSGNKIVNAMKANAIILREAVRDDFPKRMYYSSHRIVMEQFPKTYDRTTKLMSNVFTQIFGNNGNE